jgi:hypothetical protein
VNTTATPRFRIHDHLRIAAMSVLRIPRFAIQRGSFPDRHHRDRRPTPAGAGFRTPVSIEPGGMSVCAQAVLTAVRRTEPGGLALVEGGPHLIGHFFAEKILDELF